MFVGLATRRVWAEPPLPHSRPNYINLFPIPVPYPGRGKLMGSHPCFSRGGRARVLAHAVGTIYSIFQFRKTIPTQHLCKAVQTPVHYHLVVPKIVPNPPILNPKKAHQRATGEMNPCAVTPQNPINTGREHHRHRTECDEHPMPLFLKQPHLRKLIHQPPIIPRRLRNSVVLKMNPVKKSSRRLHKTLGW